MDLLLDSNGDIEVTNNEFTLVTDSDAVVQDLKTRLRTFLGEWFLDARIGVPYFQEFLIKNPDKLVMQSRIREAVLETAGILELNSLEFDFDTAQRTLDITLTATLVDNTAIEFTFNELILGD